MTTIRVIHLPPNAPPPDVAKWVIVRRDERGQFRLSVADDSAANSVNHPAPVATFKTALHVARAHAKRLMVSTIYVIGCGAE
jgi:hypothetical protein